MEDVEHYGSVEQARNAAIRWLEDRGGPWGGARDITVGKFGAMDGQESGVNTRHALRMQSQAAEEQPSKRYTRTWLSKR